MCVCVCLCACPSCLYVCVKLAGADSVSIIMASGLQSFRKQLKRASIGENIVRTLMVWETHRKEIIISA